VTALHSLIVTVFEGLPEPDPMASTALTTYTPDFTFPKTVCFPLSQVVSAVVMKNWLPLVFLPAFAIDKQ
jgi:hypothetical protein